MSTIKPREGEYVIYQGDDLPRIAEARQRLEVARRNAAVAEGAPLRVGDEAPSVDDAEDAYRAVVEETADRAVVVKVRAIGRRRFRALMLAHPPRTDDEGKTHPDDAPYEVNVETFPEALLRFIDDEDDTVRTIAEPDLTPAKLRAFVEDDLADGDFDGLWLTAYYLNRSPGADPKAGLSWTASPRSTET